LAKHKGAYVGILALAGGNEFRDNCIPMDERLLALLPRHARVVIIPAAAVRGSPRMAAENGVRHFKRLGADAAPAMVVTRAQADDPRLIQPVETADMVYLAGGDPGYLLDVLRGSALWRMMWGVYQRGGMLAGSSAGAMVLSARMRTWNVGDWVDGLKVAPLAVLVHHIGMDHESAHHLREALRKTGPALPIVGIAEATACVHVEGQTWEVAGVGGVTVYPAYPAASADSAPPLSGLPPQRLTHGGQFTL
jgi:cyanophycinase